MFDSAEEAMAHIDRGIGAARDRAEQAQRLTVELEGLRVTGRSPDDAAEVTVTHTGALVDLYLSRRLDQATLDQIRSAVLAAQSDAQAQIPDRIAELTQHAFGEDSATSRSVVEQYRGLFPPPDGDPEPRDGVLR